MHRDLRELLDVEQAMAPHRGILGGDLLERAAAEVPCEDDVDDVPRRRDAGRADRLGHRDRAFEREILLDTELLGELALQRADERLSPVHAATRKEPVLPTLLLVAAEKHPLAATQKRSHTDARLDHGRDDPKPRAPRSDRGSSSTSTIRAPGTGITTSCATRSPGSATNVRSRSVLSSTIFTSPR